MSDYYRLKPDYVWSCRFPVGTRQRTNDSRLRHHHGRLQQMSRTTPYAADVQIHNARHSDSMTSLRRAWNVPAFNARRLSIWHADMDLPPATVPPTADRMRQYDVFL